MKNPLTEQVLEVMKGGDFTVKQVCEKLQNKYNSNSVRTSLSNLYRNGKITRSTRIGNEEVRYHRVTTSQEETTLVMMNRLLAPLRGWRGA